MRVAVVFFSGRNRNRLLDVTKALARGLESQGNHVDIIDGERDINSKLTIYGYLAIGVTATSTWGGKIPGQLSVFLANAGMVTGKRCFAFTVKGGMRTGRTLSRLMRQMEQEGMYLKYSDILSTPAEAEEVGKRLHLA
ncbi:MAG TPA: hypothetical protein VMV68_09645 [Spirochaetia bacterium]|nr:hypothetical protein [Spirochaetia bacterium]